MAANHHVWADPVHVAEVYALFAGGRLPPQVEVEAVLIAFLRSILEQIPGYEGMTINPGQEGGQA
jgi:hypothetical protein